MEATEDARQALIDLELYYGLAALCYRTRCPATLAGAQGWDSKCPVRKMGLKAKKRTAPPHGGETSSNKSDRAIRVQYGTLPYRFTEANLLEVLLVTTRQTRRWIIPKGWPIKGLKPPKSAAREAYEEAGIRGTAGAKSIGVFSYEKELDANGVTVPCEVRVFPMLVKRQLETWPEAQEREARWFEPAKALSAVRDAGLRKLIDSFVGRITAQRSPR